MKTVFVVLHYESVDDTRECVDSLLKYIHEDVSVVVVDNGSVYGKASDIQEIYKGYEKIYFLYADSNLGFAKGNNLGYRFAKNDLNADVIILCNNDLIFEQNDFILNLRKSYEEDMFDVAGPRITSLVDDKNQNPVPVQYESLKQLDKRIVKYYILYFFSIFGLDAWIQRLFAKEIEEFHPEPNEDYQLFGACLILANKYIELFDGLYEHTFMYVEESILKERTNRYSLNMLYLEDIEVKHKEGASTSAIHGKGKRKRQFYYKWNLDSCWKLRAIKRGAEV